MQVPVLSVDVMRSPFGVRGVHLMTSPDAALTGSKTLPAADAYTSGSYAQVQPRYASFGATKSQNYAVHGTRGVQQLVANTRGALITSSLSLAAAQRNNNGQVSVPSSTPRQQFISEHEKGRLLMWNGQTGTVDAACFLNPAFTVHHFAIAASYVYTTVEGSAATSGAEEEMCVYVWARSDLQKVAVLRGHAGRLTALGVWPKDTSTLIATASLDGTLRLWCHEHAPLPQNGAGGDGASVYPLWMLSTAELGAVQSLTFLSEELVVAATTRCAMGFVRFPNGSAQLRRRGSVWNIETPDTLFFQTVKSTVDTDACTTFLHVCPFNHTSIGALTAGTGSTDSNLSSSPLSSPQGSGTAASSFPSTVYLVTGSTSGYIQEWAVDVENKAPAGSATEPVYVSTKCRWFYKAHCATVDSITTDMDVVLSTSLFDGASLYHRKAGNICSVTKSAAIPLLVPQRKEIIWGTVDGSLYVSSYAAFARGVENELHPLWTTRPHTTAIRGLCLSLTHDFSWDTLCTGSADGSLCVWRSVAEPRPGSAGLAGVKKSAAALLIRRLLHVVTLPPRTVENGASGKAQVKTLVVGLGPSTAGKQGVILVLELTPTGEVGQIADVPVGDNKEVSCAHLCRSDQGALSLWVGTSSGRLLHAVKKPEQKTWRALMPVHWDAKPKGGVVAIAKDAASPAIIVAVAEAIDASKSTQRLFLSEVELDPKGTAAETMLSLWEGAVSLPVTTAARKGERTFDIRWVSSVHLNGQAAPGSTAGVIVSSSDGTTVRCFRTDKKIHASTPVASWKAPEMLFTATPGGQPYSIQRNLDESSSLLNTVVTASSRNSDLVCLDVMSKSQRVLIPAKVWTTQLASLLCDVGTEKVRLAGVRRETRAAASEVVLFDDAGCGCGRVTYEGTVLSFDTPAGASASAALSYAPRIEKTSSRTSAAAQDAVAVGSPLAAACTVIAAHAGERIVFIGYEDGLLQMVDTTDMYVFCRRWGTDASGMTQPIADIRYGGHGIVLVQLANHHLCSFVVPPRSLLDQPLLS
ncbi:hypothetical protein JKF63_03248 [Porcisia hertigi]|uniref:Uncharacterized protein n=1 Tax=Porcisia hertigi TaxID=2761500 RepID=A0A836ID22_9TRYP|nr:hypothetical protein JKF63_03248 [Porcisia hertigi]